MSVPSIAHMIVLICVSVPASLVDLRTFRIPDILSLGGALVALSVAGHLSLSTRTILPLASAALGYVVAFGIFAAVAAGMAGKLGFGDVKFAGFLGACLGAPLWFLAVFLAAASGLVAAVGIVAARRHLTVGRLPFAPFLAFGGIVAAVLAWSVPVISEIIRL